MDALATDTVRVMLFQLQHIYSKRFTPNGDGNNDFFWIFGYKEREKQFEVEVFDRGGKGLPKHDMNFKWDELQGKWWTNRLVYFN